MNAKEQWVRHGIKTGDAELVEHHVKGIQEFGRGSLSACDSTGESLLNFAVRKDNSAIIRTLIRAGANPHEADDNGDLPIDVARRSGSKKALEILEALA